MIRVNEFVLKKDKQWDIFSAACKMQATEICVENI